MHTDVKLISLGRVEMWRKDKHFLIFHVSTVGEVKSPLLAIELYQHTGMGKSYLIMPERPQCEEECSKGAT